MLRVGVGVDMPGVLVVVLVVVVVVVEHLSSRHERMLGLFCNKQQYKSKHTQKSRQQCKVCVKTRLSNTKGQWQKIMGKGGQSFPNAMQTDRQTDRPILLPQRHYPIMLQQPNSTRIAKAPPTQPNTTQHNTTQHKPTSI
jgi:hypothetical protein